ncbi:MAG: MoxR family ATPase [Actinobacteria bacterium]|nr:MAG: MoxR family ATPase [Actinomycetota bacterium]TML85271.1 MAG: MoxR family ATPase [Actinomycetota bacterium]
MRRRSCCVSKADSQRLESIPAAETIRAIVDNLARVVHAPDETLSLCVLCLVSEGHLILEDFPGVGKTMLAKALARSLDVSFSRMQFTPDLLPSDVTGVNVFNQRSNEFEFRPGPVFANLLLVDEINRASPKTQAALLECMQEQQVTTDGVTNLLARPFMVMATQNPIEYEGTYPLPEAQLDRFTMRIAIGYPPLSEEAKMLTEQTADPPLDALEPVANAADAIALADDAKAVFVEESLNRYVVALLRATRGDSRLYLGASPRAGIAILRVAKARALADGRSYLEPDDIKAVAAAVLAHRLILAPEARSTGLTGEQIVRETLDKTPVPV